MRKQWFGDSRDYAKWSCIRREAKDGYTVLYGIMLRPDSFLDPSLDPDVVQFFDRLKDFAALGELFPEGFAVHDAPFEKLKADEYFDRLIERFLEIQSNGKMLVFLDPDTGIEPKGKLRDEHLRMSDISRVCAALNPLDKLVIYQHALHKADWMSDFKIRLEAMCAEMGCGLGEAFHAPGVARDVCFFVIVKTESRGGK